MRFLGSSEDSSLRIDKSTCGNYIRITIAGAVEVLPIGEWSRKLANPGDFRHKPEPEKAKVLPLGGDRA